MVIDILGVPAWAARGALRLRAAAATPALARAVRPGGARRLPRADRLAAALGALGGRRAATGGAPGTSPTTPRFLSPQRAFCAAALAAGLGGASTRELARAMADELRSRASRSTHGARRTERHAARLARIATSVAQLRRGAPGRRPRASATVWSVHAYAPYGPAAAGRRTGGGARARRSRARRLRRASAHLGDRGRRRRAPPGRPRRPARRRRNSKPARRSPRSCARWYADPRVGAVFQYTFRDDPGLPGRPRERRPEPAAPAATACGWRSLVNPRARIGPPPRPSRPRAEGDAHRAVTASHP